MITLQSYVPSKDATPKDFTAALKTIAGPKTAHFYGLYIIRSEVRSERYRFGASGVSHSNRGEADLAERLRTHANSTPPDKEVVSSNKPRKRELNQTQLRRPWGALWVCTLSGASGPITLIAEGILGLCIVENGYEMCTELGERSMFVRKDKNACLDIVVERFHDYFRESAAVLGYDVPLPADPISLPLAGVSPEDSASA